MSSYGSEIADSRSHGRVGFQAQGGRLNRAQAYNRTSLAVDSLAVGLDTFPAELAPSPRLVPVPAPAAPGIPRFMGLDQATYRRDPRSKWVSLAIHVVGIAAVLWLGFRAHNAIVEPAVVTPVDITLYAPPPPPKILPVAPTQGGGGGGGAHQLIEPTRGNPPRIVARTPVIAPQILRFDQPKLAIEPAEVVKMPDNPALPNLGLTTSSQVALASQGKGSGSGFGSGLGGGLGVGRGIGSGPGSGGGYGGGVMSVGGGVSAPQVLHSVDPEFTEEARQANFQGNCAIQLIVDAQGNPQNIRVVRHLGMGLDEKAVAAVRQYKFRPAIYQGHPVAVEIVVDVDFHLH